MGRPKAMLLLFFVASMALVLFQNCGQANYSISQKATRGIASVDENSSLDDSSMMEANDEEPILQKLVTKYNKPTPQQQDGIEAALTDCSNQNLYPQWKCQMVKVVNPKNSFYNYAVEFRINRIQRDSVGTVLWVNGNNGRDGFRHDENAKGVQDRLDESGVRSIEIVFTDPTTPASGDYEGFTGGFWKYPGGYVLAGGAYAGALAELIKLGVLRGNFLNHIGVSNGTMVAAVAMAKYNAGAVLDRVIFNSGPFLPSFKNACSNNHFARLRGQLGNEPGEEDWVLKIINTWTLGDNSKDSCRIASASDNDPNSVLGGSAVKFYPKTAVHIFMGKQELDGAFGQWILNSNLEYMSKITAAEKTRIVVDTMGHSLNWSGLYDLAVRPKPSPYVNKPIVVSYKVSEARSALPSGVIALNENIEGTVQGLPQDATYSCIEISTGSDCDNPEKWVKMPANGWTFSNGMWRTTLKVTTQQLEKGTQLKQLWYNGKTGQRLQKKITLKECSPKSAKSSAWICR
jgi:hypothetical protein